MVRILYEDEQIIVVEKPIGMESQASAGFEADMVSEIKKHINNLCPKGGEPYVGVIHRLDKPVGGVMVYAKTPKAAAALSRQLRENKIHKRYKAVVCGKPVDNVGCYVDYLLKNGKKNQSDIVDKGTSGAKYAELRYRVVETLKREDRELTLLEIELLTGRHHQIRVQFAGHHLPLWGDNRYNPEFAMGGAGKRSNLALAAYQLTFCHPETGRTMTFTLPPSGEIFEEFHAG